MIPSTQTTQSESSPLLAHDNVHSGNGTIQDPASDASNANGSEEQQLQAPDDPTTLQLLIVMSGPWLGVVLAAMDSTIIATLSAPISSSLNSLTLLSWLGAAYLIANAVIQPISGRLTDILSRKTGLIAANILFALGNLICGLARTEWVIIFGRVVAGLGGGGLNCICTFLVADIIPLRRRGLWQGFGNVLFGAGAGLGALFGGWINDVWDWRVAFLMMVPLTILSGSLAFFTLKKPVKDNEKGVLKRIDFLGAFTLTLALVLLLIGINSGGNIVPWTHPLVLATIPLSMGFLGIFIYVEKTHAAEPIIPIELLFNRTVSAAFLTSWFSSMCLFTILFYGPIYFQTRGLSTTQAGIRIIPQFVGGAVGSLVSGWIIRQTGRYYLLILGIQVIFVVGLTIASTWTLSTSTWATELAIFLCGMAHSSMLVTTLVAFVAAVEYQHQAVITSAWYVFRSTGSSMGITIASAVFQNILDVKLRARLGDLPNAADVIAKLRNSLELDQVPHGWRSIVIGTYMDALRGVFVTTLGIGVLGLMASLFIKEHALHTNLSGK